MKFGCGQLDVFVDLADLKMTFGYFVALTDF